MTRSPHHRRGTYWFVSDGYIWDTKPASFRPESGRPVECSSVLSLFNPQSRPANVCVHFYHVDRTPTAIELMVPPRSLLEQELAVLPEIPHNQSFWTVVESDIPVYPQTCHADFTGWDPTPDALIAVAPYPGPLEDESSWVFPDCYQGGPKEWYEQETLTILNPDSSPVTVRVRYFLRARSMGGEETVEIPGQRVASLRVWERNPSLLDITDGPPIKVMGDYAVRIDATGPVITQSSRRARWTGQPAVVGARSTMGIPLGDSVPAQWHYPGGYIVDYGILPRDQNCDVTWNLLFTHNLNTERKARATVTFHNVDGHTRQAEPYTIAPARSDLKWLHLAPWLGDYVAVGKPFGMTVQADSPIAPEVTCAEFEMWSHVCPGAMSAVNFYPGPLEDETFWWLGITRFGGSDEEPVEWQPSYHFFNPGEAPVTVTLSFAGLDGAVPETQVQAQVAPNGVTRVPLDSIDALPVGKPFAVYAQADAPFCAQAFVRARTRGAAPVRAMYSHMGVPLQLGQGGNN